MSDRKAMWDTFKTFMGGFIFQVFVGFVAGTIVAGYGMYYYQKYRMEETVIMLKCFVYNNKVYQITERP